MQVLYVVDFGVSPVQEGVDPYQEALACVSEWLTFAAGDGVPVELLQGSGGKELNPNKAGDPRKAAWEVAGSVSHRALRVEVRDENPELDSFFVTRVTLSDIEGKVGIRISMARETSPTWLSPAPPPVLRQPGIVRSLILNENILISVSGQQQDGRYIPVRTDLEVETLVGAIQNPARLPLLLMHTRTLAALDTAKESANKLIGLVRVVTLDYRASRSLYERLPGYAPPYAGARLVWSDPEAKQMTFDEAEVNGGNPGYLRDRLMRVLSPISVLARGIDHAFREARRAEISQQSTEARSRSELAKASGDMEARLDAIQEELEVARIEAEQWRILATEEEDRANRFQAQAEKAPKLEEQVEQLLYALRATQDAQGRPNEPEDAWDNLPELVTGDVSSAEDLFLHLEDLSSSRIVFTAHAKNSWKKSKYPFPSEMHECLVKLARVSIALYDGTDRSMPHLDTWIRDEFDLKVSLQDQRIERDRKLRDFLYENRTWSRTPHVKVRDHTAPSQVGRIYFAFDSEHGRLIVDHVGLKLY
ncbi:hypothetical protein [Nocardiopsis halotolerans]|uniref:hypothetical protein n=1 Tax=Nocardiopsis halotolerans TaxID=124252 RepID=UPI00034C9FBA|nr:hypothetical protein [Nocardiopsis halotolerans]